jgi:thiol-disulfide isomerase/thioredoxin
VAGALLSLLLAACSSGPEGEPVPGVRAGVLLPAPEDRGSAPLDVAAPLLGEGDEEIALEELLGQVVVVNFWGSWCGPCRREQPELNTAAEALADEPVTFLGVNVDDSVPNALAHEREFAMPYRSVYDDDASYAARFGGIGAAAVPTTLVIDGEGRVALRLIGETDALEVLAAVQRVLEELPPA